MNGSADSMQSGGVDSDVASFETATASSVDDELSSSSASADASASAAYMATYPQAPQKMFHPTKKGMMESAVSSLLNDGDAISSAKISSAGSSYKQISSSSGYK